MHLVCENLFIGNISDAAEVLQNGSTEVTHILSVLSSASISFFTEWRSSLTIPSKEIKEAYVGGSGGAVNSEDVGSGGSKSCLSPEKLFYSLEHAGKDLKFVRMAVPIKDTESEVLLDYLDPCLEFIEKSRKEGSVLVHCLAGVSRSAAIITAYLMRSEQLSAEGALESLRQSCDFVCPNDGFIEQLQMFEEMGFKVNRDSPIYKKFRLRVLGDSYNRGAKIDSSKFAADPGLPTEAPSEVKASPNRPVDCKIAYRCKKCRRIVASQENVVDHVPGEGESSFGWNKRRGGNPFDKSDEFECSSVFIEPLQWMTAGKLCPTTYSSKLKKGHWRASYLVHIAMLDLVTSIGRVYSAVVGAGSHLLFSSIEAELISASCDAERSREGGYPARTSSVKYTANNKSRPQLGGSKYGTPCQYPFMARNRFVSVTPLELARSRFGLHLRVMAWFFRVTA